jgi:hypothetical protein
MRLLLPGGMSTMSNLFGFQLSFSDFEKTFQDFLK